MLSILLAAGVAVLVAVWTSRWAWPAGVGLAVLVMLQGSVEWLRTKENATSGNHNRRLSLTQDATSLADSRVAGVRGQPIDMDIDVHQALGNVERSAIIGIDMTPAVRRQPETEAADEPTAPETEV